MPRLFAASWLLPPVLTATIAVVACQDESGGRIAAPTDTIASDEVVIELGTRVGRVTRHPDGVVPRIDGVQPARARGRRLALLAPVPSTVEYDLHVPPGGVLRVGTAVALEDDAEGRLESAAPIRFRVRVAGETLWERVWDPGRRGGRRRHWVDAEIDLGRFADRDVPLVLETDASEESSAIGTPAWSRVQLVRRTVVPRQGASPQAPNVLLLVVDTLRADRLGAYGAHPTRTPNLDRLAATGVVFRNAWAQAPWTLPSVATILTGRYPRSHGVVGRSADFGRPAGVEDHEGNWAYLADGIPTIASLVRRAGVSTFGATSNLLVSRENNLARGFETFVELPVSPMPIQWARANAVHRAFGEWLNVAGRRRFFAYLHYMEPHDPYVPAPGLRDRCPQGTPADVCDGVVRNLARERERGGGPIAEPLVRYLEALYDGEVRAWDAALPELLALLDRHGLRDRTVVVVTADHGEEFGEHGHLGHRKQLYAESLAVPLVVAGPGIPAGERHDVAELVDVMPTILGLMSTAAGASGPEAGIPGKDLLQGDTERSRTFAETRYGVLDGGRDGLELRAVRGSSWGYMRAPAVGYERLYDLTEDPGETTDRAGANPEVCEELRAELEAWKARTTPLGEPPSQSEQITDKLRALGYVD